MPTIVKVPEGLGNLDAERLNPSEGDHNVKPTHVNNETAGCPIVRFQVIEGPDKGLALSQRYNFGYERGRTAFKGLLDAFGIRPDGNGDVDLDVVLGKELVVTIAHRTRGGKTYANVVEHRPAS